MDSLENQLEAEFVTLGISEPNRKSVRSYLELLKRKDQDTYEHSVRVGLLGVKLGRYIKGLDSKALFFSGSLHDVGKLLIDPEVLRKTEGFNEEDMKKMEAHVYYSYLLLRGVHEFSAQIVVRHHKFQENGYPDDLPEIGPPFSEGTKVMVDVYARLLSLIDSYDAAITRPSNEIGGEGKIRTPIEVRALMLEKNPDQVRLIRELYAGGIFEDSDNETKRLLAEGQKPSEPDVTLQKMAEFIRGDEGDD